MGTSTPHLIVTPTAPEQLKIGFDTVGRLLASTLGPAQGIILSTKQFVGPPEILSDAGTIARRLLAIPDRRQDVGAMLLRNLVWRVHQRVGDGTATTAVLAQALLDHATRMVTAGANPVAVQAGIEQASTAVLAQLTTLARPADSFEPLAAVGRSATGHDQLGDLIGEMVALLGPNSHITIRDYLAPELERTYLAGGQWRGELISPHMITAVGSQKAIIGPAQIVCFAGKVNTIADAMAALKPALADPPTNLLLVAYEFSEEATIALTRAHTHPQVQANVIGFKLEKAGESGRDDLADLACLCAATVLGDEHGHPLASLTPNEIGKARRIEANRDQLLVIGGISVSDGDTIDQSLDTLKKRLARLPFDDKQLPRLRERIGRLSNKSAVLRIGALTKTERAHLHNQAQQGITAVQSARRSGVVPGGGIAYARCAAVIDRLLDTAPNQDTRFGMLAVRHALFAPLTQLIRNTDPSTVPELIIDQLTDRAPFDVYDVLQNCWVAGEDSNALLDSAEVAQVAFETAVSGAIMALSIDCVVLKRNPEMSTEP